MSGQWLSGCGVDMDPKLVQRIQQLIRRIDPTTTSIDDGYVLTYLIKLVSLEKFTFEQMEESITVLVSNARKISKGLEEQWHLDSNSHMDEK